MWGQTDMCHPDVMQGEGYSIACGVFLLRMFTLSIRIRLVSHKHLGLWEQLRDLAGWFSASGCCVDADVTAALGTPDTVNKPFQAQMQCFLTIWSMLQCRVLQTGDDVEFRNPEPQAPETYLEEPSKLPQFSWLPRIMFPFVCHSFICPTTTHHYGAASMQ